MEKTGTLWFGVNHTEKSFWTAWTGKEKSEVKSLSALVKVMGYKHVVYED